MLGFEKIIQGPRFFYQFFFLFFFNSFNAPAFHRCDILLFIDNVPRDWIMHINPGNPNWLKIILKDGKFVRGCEQQVKMQKINLLFDDENNISVNFFLEDDKNYYLPYRLENIDRNPLHIPMIFVCKKNVYKMHETDLNIFIEADKIDFDDNYD